MTFGSLFAGIGGIDLGLERAGLTCKWQVEIDEYCRRVLAKHWPDVPRWDDVRKFPDADTLKEIKVDLIAGGFPCQDISNAGKRKGIDGERSGLWFEFARVIRLLRPRFVLVENSSELPIRGLDRVLGSIAEIGLDAEWQIISARSAGAPHLRRRTFILCYPNGSRCSPVMDAKAFQEWKESSNGTWWDSEPGIQRVVDRTSVVVDRLRALGNAVVPQVAEYIGKQLIAAL